MKNIKKLFLLTAVLAVIVCAFSLAVGAATYGVLTYTVTNGEVTITDCSTSAAGELVIPSTIEGYPVTSIGNYAFRYCSSLTSIEKFPRA